MDFKQLLWELLISLEKNLKYSLRRHCWTVDAEPHAGGFISINIHLWVTYSIGNTRGWYINACGSARVPSCLTSRLITGLSFTYSAMYPVKATAQ